MMKAQIQKSTDGFSIQIPEALAEEAGLAGQTSIEMKLINGRIVLIPMKHNLDDLLSQITDENRHDEIR